MKKGQFIFLISVVIISFGIIFGYLKYKLDNDEIINTNTEQLGNSNQNDTNEKPEIIENETQNNTEQMDSTPMKGNEDKNVWKEDALKNSNIITVIGTSWCPNCQVFEPIMQEIKNEYNLNLYFFKIDLLTSEESNELLNTFELTGYRGSIPYTAVISQGKVIANHTGRMTKESLINFLKENSVIK